MRDYYRRASRLHEVCRAFVRVRARAAAAPPPVRGAAAARAPAGTRRGRRAPAARAARGCAAGRRCSRCSSAPRRACRCRASSRPRSARRPTLVAAAASLARGGRGAAAPGVSTAAAWSRRCGRSTRRASCSGSMPEWARITFLVQHDFFHKYTVDEHTLRAVEALDELAAGRDPQEAAARAHLRRGRGRAPALPRHAAPRHRQGARRRPRGEGGAWSRGGCSPASGSAATSRTPSCSWSARTSRCRRPRSSATSTSRR